MSGIWAAALDKKGRELLREGRYGEAAEVFREACRLEDNPGAALEGAAIEHRVRLANIIVGCTDCKYHILQEQCAAKRVPTAHRWEGRLGRTRYIRRRKGSKEMTKWELIGRARLAGLPVIWTFYPLSGRM